MSKNEPAPTRQPRWGVRALIWLTLAFMCVIASNFLVAAGNTDWVVPAFVGTVVGLVGAAYCSVRGMASAGWLR